MPIDNVAEFILYIAPGFIAIFIYNWYFPSKETDSFTKIASCIVLGVFITSFAKWLDKYFLNYFLSSNGDPLNPRFLTSLFIFGFIGGWVLIGQKELRRYLAKSDSDYNWVNRNLESTWSIINGKDNTNWAIVFLTDGSIYLGWLHRFDNDPNDDNHGFLLADAVRLFDNLEENYPVDGIGVFIQTSNVLRIEYRIKDYDKNGLLSDTD